MRARYPDQEGFVERDGVKLYWELFGSGERTLFFLPTWSIIHSQFWKAQVPYFARHVRVLTFDGRGNGKSDRPRDAASYDDREIMADALAVMDATATERAMLVCECHATLQVLLLAVEHPERVSGAVFIPANGPVTPLSRPVYSFDDELDTEEGWAKFNRHYWLRDYQGFLEFFFAQLFSEPHSTKQIEDCVRWGLETTPETLIATISYPSPGRDELRDQLLALCARVRCPTLVIQGSADRLNPLERAEVFAGAMGGSLLTLEGCGHGPYARDPVRVNRALAEFAGLPTPLRQTWRRAAARQTPRALFVSSPIGLGHVQRDLAIARELRRLVPDLEIDWLAQHPVTAVLDAAGERIHPMSRHLASESAHWEQAAGEHELHCFMAWREMDEILLANFMVYLDSVRETPYDLWIGDEAWEVDYYLHENPELKTAPFVFLSDFLGWLPMPDGGEREAFLAADYNAEMIEQIARYPRVRDRAIYIGDYDDLVPERFGPGLPLIPEWAREHFSAVGYITPFDPADYADTRALRVRLGYDPDRPLVVLAVGGTGVGQHLLRKAIDAWPLIRRERPDAHCIAVAGPRIDPDSLPRHEGLEVRPYVHDLYEHLAAADLGIVQGGLGTTMELATNRRPFIYVPLRNHCEQVYHVAQRLDCYHAGRRLDYADTSVEALAQVALETLGADTSRYKPHDPRGAARAAALITELL